MDHSSGNLKDSNAEWNVDTWGPACEFPSTSRSVTMNLSKTIHVIIVQKYDFILLVSHELEWS